MKILVEAEFRCREHEKCENACAVCCDLQRLRMQLEITRAKRARLIERLKVHAINNEILICGIK